MNKSLYIFPMFAPLLFAACVPLGGNESPPAKCGVETPAEVIGYTKEGSPIRMEPTLIAPCPVSTPHNPNVPDVPDVPDVAKEKCNSGRGNGSEYTPDCDPGNSGGHNKGGD